MYQTGGLGICGPYWGSGDPTGGLGTLLGAWGLHWGSGDPTGGSGDPIGGSGGHTGTRLVPSYHLGPGFEH